MAFPATYNISYYRGDTYSFIINPKNSDGSDFNLSGFTATFQIKATRSRTAAVSASGTAATDSPVNGAITCTIPAVDGSSLVAGTYYYDVQIKNSGNVTYTLVTGTITVTDDVVV